jgi:DNA-directed RNA polymerase subunit F
MKDLEGREEILPVQSRTIQYLKKFAKVDSEVAMRIKKRLLEIEEIDEEKAVQIINILPRTQEEIKEIFHEKIIVGELATKILSILKEEGVI